MLKTLKLKNVGPAPQLELEFASSLSDLDDNYLKNF